MNDSVVSSLKSGRRGPALARSLFAFGQTSEPVPTMQSTSLLDGASAAGGAFSDVASDHKYLHKKFKRIASVTVDENFTDSNSADATARRPAPPHANGIAAPRKPSLINGDSGDGAFGQRGQNFPLSSLGNSRSASSPPSATKSSTNNSDINSTCDFSKKNLSANSNLSERELSRFQYAQEVYDNDSQTKSISMDELSAAGASAGAAAANASGENVCPYCSLNCTKRSVLIKHIRAHTNERPYPCDTCKTAFKTKSNLHKHYK